MQNREVICFGYVHKECKAFSLTIPKDIQKVIVSFYIPRFEFNRDHKSFEISDDGLTQTTIKSTIGNGRPTNTFGEYLQHKYKDSYECKLRLDAGGYSGLLIGFITEGFDEFYFDSDSSSCRPSKYTCMAAANGWFKIDDSCFTCKQAKNLKHQDDSYQFFKSDGEILTIKADMKKKVGYIGKYKISLPDSVCIAVCSNAEHVLTVVENGSVSAPKKSVLDKLKTVSLF